MGATHSRCRLTPHPVLTTWTTSDYSADADTQAKRCLVGGISVSAALRATRRAAANAILAHRSGSLSQTCKFYLTQTFISHKRPTRFMPPPDPPSHRHHRSQTLIRRPRTRTTTRGLSFSLVEWSRTRMTRHGAVPRPTATGLSTPMVDSIRPKIRLRVRGGPGVEVGVRVASRVGVEVRCSRSPVFV